MKVLNSPHALLLGSRALGVSHSESDYDVAFSVEHMPAPFAKENLTSGASIELYFHLIPPYGKGWKLSYYEEDVKVDCLFFDDARSMEQLSAAISSLKKYPQFIIEDKSLRVGLFEAHLKQLGWKEPIEAEDDEIPY